MMSRSFHLALLAGFFIFLGSTAIHAQEGSNLTASTGAEVNESQVQVTLYVDAANAEAADDDQHGTAEAPLATLHYACQAAEKAKDSGKGTKIIIAAGTYREAIEIRPPANGKPDPDVPLIIEAAERDQTVIDGADTEGWTPSSWKEEGGHWVHPWPFLRRTVRGTSYGNQPPTAVAAAHRYGDLVIVNGMPLRQVNSPNELQPGSFFGKPPLPNSGNTRHGGAIDPANEPMVFVQPPEDAALAEALIQVGIRPCGLMVTGRRNVVVRGLLFQHAASPTAPAAGEGYNPPASVVISRCANVLIEDVLSQWNDGVGMYIVDQGTAGRPGVTLRRVKLLHNGDMGLVVSGVQNLVAEDCEASFNNFRGEWAGWIDPLRPAGVKASMVDGSVWRRQRIIGNQCRGLWLVGGNRHNVEEAVVRDNFVSGLLVDSCSGPTRVGRCLVTGTKEAANVREDAVCSAAVSIFASSKVTLESNVVAANDVPALGVSDVSPGGNINAKSKPENSRTEALTLKHNVFSGREASQLLCDLPTMDRTGSRLDFSSLYNTLDVQENDFWNPAAEDVFCIYDKNGHKRTPMNLAGWQTYLATHAGKNTDKESAAASQWRDPLFVNPTEGDFRLQENSPCKDWNLLGDEDSTGM